MKLRLVKHLTVTRLNPPPSSSAERTLNAGETVEIVGNTGVLDTDPVYFNSPRDGVCACRKGDLFGAVTPVSE